MIGTRREVIVAKRGGVFAFVALSAALAASVLVLSFGPALPAQAQGTTNTINADSAQDTDTSGDGDCTLREAIGNADSDGDTTGGDCAAGSSTGEDAIAFDLGPSATITLGSTLPAVTDGDGLSIDGEEDEITVSGDDAVGVLEVNPGAELALRDLTVANGRAGFGGGIENDVGTLTVTNSTFSENSAVFGGGIENHGPATLRNTIVANSPSGDNCFDTRSITDGGGNLDDGSSCAFTAPSSQSNADDGLDPAGLQDNGGPTRTIALLPESDAIDAGVEATCAADPVNNLDQRGTSRPQDGDANNEARCDIGTFEFRPTSFSVSDASAVTEGDSGTTNATFTVTRTPGDGPASSSVSYATSDGTATAPEDYASTSGTLEFAAGETSKTVEVAVKGDTLDEENETFTLGLGSPFTGATITDGSGTITDDEATTPTPTTPDDCTIVGTEGDDETTGTQGYDKICARAGNDTVRGFGKPDFILGEEGKDTLYGGRGNDRISGGPGEDKIFAKRGDNDRVEARDGEVDVVDCGPGTNDIALVDRNDKVSNCEKVNRK